MRRILAASLLVACAPVFADGSGTLNDATATLDYSGGTPLIVPNLLVLADSSAPPPTCMDGAPTCDTYALTVDLSDAYRAANQGKRVSLTLAFADDWDMWLLDSAGNVVAGAASTDNPEVISLGLAQLPNGSYLVQATPFVPDPAGFTLTVAAGVARSATLAGAGAAKSGEGLALGAFGLPALLSLLGLSLLRRRG